jgi:glycosyltransferase involved in cell wall biosynthesis
MKKVLLISFIFPPAGGIGVQRNLKYVKYLSQLNWQTFVLTMKADYYFLQDKTLMKDIPINTKIFSTECLKPKQKLFFWQESNPESDPKSYKKLYELITRFIEKEFIIPDKWIGWIPFALIKGSEILKNNKIDVILCSGPSFTSFIVGFILSKKTKLPLVLDYRDGWFLDAHRKTSSINFLKNTIDHYLEKVILKQCSNAIFVSNHLLNLYRNKFNFIKNKSIVISNGFDKADLLENKQASIKQNNKIIISHVGGCDPSARKPLIILYLKILETILKNNPKLKDKLQIQFVGIVSQDIREQIQKHHLENVIKTINFVPHNKAIKFMQNSDALLLFSILSTNNKAILTGKLFEYLMVKKPILAFTPIDSAASQVIQETKSGIVVDCETETTDVMVDKVSDFIDKIISNDFNIDNNKFIAKYERKELTKKLAKVLESSIHKNRQL